MPSKFAQCLRQQFERVRAERDESTALDYIANSVETELRKLVAYIEKTKADVGKLKPDNLPNPNQLLSARDELDAIVSHTAEATSVFLDAADQMQALSATLPEASANAIRDITTKIYEASTFQDITAQRVTKIANALKQVEDKLEAILGQGVTAGVAAAPVEAPKGEEGLLNGPQLPKNAKTQDEIDALFND